MVDVLGYVIQGIFIAIGSVIGNYISNKVLINRFEQAMKIVRPVREAKK